MKLKDNVVFWNKRSEIFDQHVLKIYKTAYEKTIDRTLQYVKVTDCVLDVGCGTGVTTIDLAKSVGHVIAIDTSPEMMRQAKQKAEAAGAKNITFYRTDMFDRRFSPGQFDVIMIYNVLLYIKEQESALLRLYRLLKPGGHLLLAADCLKYSFTKEALRKLLRSRTGRMPFVKFYTPKSLMSAIKLCGFQIIKAEELHAQPVNLFIAAKKP